MALMDYIYDDGGRSLYFKGQTGDCVCRAIAIASGRNYKEVYDNMFKTLGQSPRLGVNPRSVKFKRMMEAWGFRWISTSGIGAHQAVHFIQGELPEGRLVCQVTKHMVAVVDNQVRDIFDSRLNSFGENRRIYGYWRMEDKQ